MGWGWADHELATGGKPGHHHEGDCDAGGATNGTNQIGELCAVLEALRAHPGSEPLVIETDSQYAINCSTTWVHGWEKNGWKNSQKKPVKNADLIRAIDAEISKRPGSVKFVWVKGHAGSSTTWVHGWEKNGWKNSQKKPVKNADLIRAIDAEISKRPGSVKFVWVKGHAGNAGNEKVDELARTYAGDCRSKVREGYLPLEGWQSLLASEYSQGIDVPDDAQMLLDGKITSDEYHIGRGQGESAGGSLADDLIGVSDPEPRPRSIADMLVEPEGYPTPDEATLPLPPNGMPAESDEMPEPTTVLATAVSDSTPSDTATSDSTQSDTTAPRKSYAEMLIKTDYFPREDAENASDGTLQPTQSEQAATRSDETADSLQSPETQESLADAPQSAMQPQQSQQPRRKSPSGLSVSGTIRFTPPPNSSPTFDGRLRRIRGYIAVEGYVQGDGTLVLEDAPFAVKHN